MQIKGAIKWFAILLAIVCLYQLSFTVVTKSVEKKADKYSKGEYVMKEFNTLKTNDELVDAKIIDSLQTHKREYYLDSISTEPVYNILVKKFSYADCKEREINLGLDLRGGMNVMMQVAVRDVIEALSNNSTDPTFLKALDLASERLKSSQTGYIKLFYDAFREIDPNAKLAGIFAYEFKDKGISTTSTNEEVYKVLEAETEDAINRSYEILSTRIDRFGVAQPNIQRIPGTGRVSIELPGVKDASRVRNLLQGTASLEFWETYKFSEIYQFFLDANAKLARMNALQTTEEDVEKELDKNSVEEVVEEVKETVEDVVDEATDLAKGEETLEEEEKDELEALLEADSLDKDEDLSLEEWRKENPLFAYLMPAFYASNDGMQYPSEGAAVGTARVNDTAIVNRMLAKVKDDLPKNLKLAWTVKPEASMPNMLQLVALKVTNPDGKAPLSGDVITDARQDYDAQGNVEVSITMNQEPGARLWKNLTGQNINRQIAIVLDGYVYSFPNVRNEISGGRSSISGGNMTLEEAQDIATVLKAGKLPAPARIIQEEVVGPSLGQQSVKWGMISFVIAFLIVILIMVIYYNNAGWVASLALVCNVFFIFGILASIGAVLTLPGLAGLVLTMGMAVDANVIIYERIKEEIRAGKGMRLAIEDGYKNAYSAIIDGNVTTLITAIVLYMLGSGPIKGFATTLLIGILCSMFTAIFITRLVFDKRVKKDKSIKFVSNFNKNWFNDLAYPYIEKRKIYYIISGVLILIGIVSLSTRGLSLGVDFAGGRSYVVRFDKDVVTADIATALEDDFGSAPEVKTFGPDRQVKITTNYKVEESSEEVEEEINKILFNNLKQFYEDVDITYEDFATQGVDKLVGVLSATKVGPTFATDMKIKSFWAVIISLGLIFIYIIIRFRRWQYALSSVICLTHDAFITISCYSLFVGILPFSLEVDQSFIAAILTIIGYSLNATVVIFDRGRENNKLYPKHSLKDNLTSAVNSTVGRSVMTTVTTLVVLIVIFILAGESIRGMAFSLIVGMGIGLYSSVFLSSSLAYDFSKNKNEQIEDNKSKKNRK